MCLLLSVLVCVLAGALWRTARRRRRWPESATQFRALFEEAPVAYLRIPGEADRRSGLMAITIPG
jgi:hypothetical protein